MAELIVLTLFLAWGAFCFFKFWRPMYRRYLKPQPTPPIDSEAK